MSKFRLLHSVVTVCVVAAMAALSGCTCDAAEVTSTSAAEFTDRGTYRSRYGVELVSMTPKPGTREELDQVIITASVRFPTSTTTPKEFAVTREGKLIATSRQTKPKGSTTYEYRWADFGAAPGDHEYVFQVSGILVSSPARITVANTPAPAGSGRIVFARHDGHIYMIRPDGTGLTQLTNSRNVVDSNPVLSHDGKKIAFLRSAGTSRVGRLHLMDTSGGFILSVTTAPPYVSSVDWSPDDRCLLLWGGDALDFTQDTYTLSVDGTELTKLPSALRTNSPPRFSPDGTRIAFSSADTPSRICLSDLGGAHVTRLPSAGDRHSPSWSADGQLLFSSSCDSRKPGEERELSDYSLRITTVEGKPVLAWGQRYDERVGFYGDGSAYAASWSPDSHQLVFEGSRSISAGDECGELQCGLFIINADGTDLRFLTEGITPHWGAGAITTPVIPQYRTNRTWGGYGHGAGQFCAPTDVAVNQEGCVYVCDYENDRIQKFSPTGGFVTMWGRTGNGGAGEFAGLEGLTVDSHTNIYVVDSTNNRIQKFTSDGEFITKWTVPASHKREFYQPSAIAVDSADNVYVVASWSHRVWKFASDGRFLASWTSGAASSGEADFPIGSSAVAVDRSGNVYVLNIEHSRLEEFSPEGKLTSIYDIEGSCMAVDDTGRLYIGGNGIRIFSQRGCLLGNLQVDGRPFDLKGVSGVGLGRDGSICVSDATNEHVRRLTPVTAKE